MVVGLFTYVHHRCHRCLLHHHCFHPVGQGTGATTAGWYPISVLSPCRYADIYIQNTAVSETKSRKNDLLFRDHDTFVYTVTDNHISSLPGTLAFLCQPHL